ncbi:MAG TPA: HypC/HybG/HupF family hydrogenase formation chaperone [Gaiellales bacterium]|jgi:hydrogenase maturation factor|nr:HypC/HybG/HupF family hydrogenase formation chaperone [Gaiellales bacterium]
MSAGAGTWASPDCGEAHCITCGDQGIPLLVVALEGNGLARCRNEAAPAEPDATVDVQLVGAVARGDLLLVHAGVALAHLGAAASA